MRTIVITVALLVILSVAIVTGLEITAINTPSDSANYKALAETLRSLGLQGWSFIKPILQLVIILLVFEWFGKKLGVNINLNEIRMGGNVQVFIAAIIIVSFCIAALSGIEQVESLKEIALIVVGFYFGSRGNEKKNNGPDTNLDG